MSPKIYLAAKYTERVRRIAGLRCQKFDKYLRLKILIHIPPLVSDAMNTELVARGTSRVSNKKKAGGGRISSLGPLI